MIESNISLSQFNTFKIDVKARFFSRFNSIEKLKELLVTSALKSNNRLILGGGSNLLFTQDFNGIVLKNELMGIELIRQDDLHFYVKAFAGEIWHDLVMYCINNGYAGMENLALIPGCVGASPMQNIGAYGVEIKDIFHSLEAINIADGFTKTFTKEECEFGYRESVFKRKQKDQWIILSVQFKLSKRPTLNTSYGSIDIELEKMNLDKITIKDIAQAVINIRRLKLPDPAIIGNAGSFFKNPVVPISVYEKIKSKFNNAPCYPINDKEVKIPAGWLIENTGWKGKTYDNYGVHKNQALVLVNYGGATGKQIFNLSSEIIESIQNQFGITLEREVNII